MIPRNDKSELKLIFNEVRNATETRWNLRQRFNLWFGENPDAPVALSLGILAGMLLIVSLMVGFVTYGAWQYWQWYQNAGELGIERNWPAHWPSSRSAPNPTATIALGGGMASALAFFCFFGGPSRNRHRTSLLYPHLDRSVGHYVSTRTMWGFGILWFFNLILFIVMTTSCGIGKFSWIGCLAYPPIQSVFHLSFVLLIARKWTPVMENYFVSGVGMLLFFAGATAIFPYPEKRPSLAKDLIAFHESAQLYLYPPGWITNLWFKHEQMNSWLLLAVIGMVAWCLIEGIRSFIHLQPLAPADSLDGDSIALLNHVITVDEANQIEHEDALSITNSEAPIFQLMEDLENDDARTRGPMTVLKETALELINAFNLAEAPLWYRIVVSSILLFAFSLVVITAICFIGSCFKSPVDFSSQRFARSISAILILLPLMPAWMTLIAQQKAAIYPVGNMTLRVRMLKKYAQWLATMLPVWAILNVAFCCYYNIEVFDKVLLVLEPVIVGIAALLFVLPAAGAGMKLSEVINAVLLATIAVAVTAILLIGVCTVLTPNDAISSIEVLFDDSTIGTVRVLYAARSLILLAFAAVVCLVGITIKDRSNCDIADPLTIVEAANRRQQHHSANHSI